LGAIDHFAIHQMGGKGESVSERITTRATAGDRNHSLAAYGPAVLSDAASDDLPIWVFLTSGPLIAFSQFIWLLMDRRLQPGTFPVNFPFHLLNIFLGCGVVGIVVIRPLRVRWRIAGSAVEAILMVSMAFIVAHGGEPGEMISAIAFIVVGSALLIPWTRPWQILVEFSSFAAIASFTIHRSLAPYDWFASLAVIMGSHLLFELVDYNRRQIAAGKASLEANIKELQATQRQLIDAREQALAASLAKTEFLSSMSHEIRTPMNAILGMAELLEESQPTPAQRKYLEVMSHNGDALLILINDILDLAKVESGRLLLEHVEFDFEEMLDQTVETLAARAAGKGLELVSHILPDVPLNLIGDPLRLRQVLINLLGNAIKFTTAGQVVLTVERVTGSNHPGELHFSVTDSGIGIAQDKLGEIFANFTQADSSTTRRYGGSGLGLAIVKRLVELMEGKVWVESELGQGSIFHFTAKLGIQQKDRVEKFSTLTVLLSGSRALVVDDNSTNRLILRETLSSRGAYVSEAESGPMALWAVEAARQAGRPFDLMLLDCRMPEMDGFEVAQRLRGSRRDELTIMMLSSDDLKVEVAQVHELGLDAYLVKPVRRRELFEAIGKAMATQSSARGERNGQLISPSDHVASVDILPPRNTERLRLLLADDSADNRLLIRAFLQNSLFDVEDAANGAIAVEKIRNGRYHIVLMDMQMPVMGGLEAIGAIRQLETSARLPWHRIIALTASALEEDIRRSREAGADLHLTKPIKKAMLLAALSASLPAPNGASRITEVA
jgi:two-component system, sensor histidine kinase and response regulator